MRGSDRLKNKKKDEFRTDDEGRSDDATSLALLMETQKPSALIP